MYMWILAVRYSRLQWELLSVPDTLGVGVLIKGDVLISESGEFLYTFYIS